MKQIFLLLSLSLCLACFAASKPKDKAIEPTHLGKVTGQVYDAITGNPIPKAIITAEVEGVFAEKGRSIGTTNETGSYKCDAQLGRISSNLDIGRLLFTSALGVLLGGATNVTKRIDVTRLNMRVTCDGYQTYEGIVMCRTADAATFTVGMEPVLLTPVGSKEVSTTANDWGAVRITGVRAEPQMLRPGEESSITVELQCPPVLRSKLLEIRCSSSEWKGSKLKLEKGVEGDALRFTGKFKISKKAKPGLVPITVSLIKCPYDVIQGGDTYTTFFSIVTDEPTVAAAQIRQDAIKLAGEDKPAEALTKLKELFVRPEVTTLDLHYMTYISLKTKDTASEVEATRRLVGMSPEKGRMAPITWYARALVRNAQPDTVILEFAPLVQSIKLKDRPKKIPCELMLALGTSYLRLGKLDEAKKISEELLKWPTTAGNPSVSKFRVELRLAEVESAVKTDASSAKAWTDYGRALSDSGRWEEAVEKYQQALKLDPAAEAVKRDLAYTLTHLSGAAGVKQINLDEAILAAEAQAGDPASKNKSKDFSTWHSLGILLYCKACSLQALADPTATEVFARSRKMLQEALHCGRTGANVDSGLYAGYYVGYLSSRVVAISGFAYREANSDFVILDSLKILENNPKNYLAHLNLALALVDLNHPELVDDSLNKCLAINPNCNEAKFLRSYVLLARNDTNAAVAQLQEVLSVNPRHPLANSLLAKLFADDGKMVEAAACLAAKSKFYGSNEQSFEAVLSNDTL
jgi:tetratricopeptide (TPR) repeat protein